MSRIVAERVGILHLSPLATVVEDLLLHMRQMLGRYGRIGGASFIHSLRRHWNSAGEERQQELAKLGMEQLERGHALGRFTFTEQRYQLVVDGALDRCRRQLRDVRDLRDRQRSVRNAEQQ